MVCLCKTYMHTHAHPGGSHCEHSPYTQPFWERTFTPPENTVTNISYSIPVTSISYGTLSTDRRSSLSKHRNEGKYHGDVSTTFLANPWPTIPPSSWVRRRSPSLPNYAWHATNRRIPLYIIRRQQHILLRGCREWRKHKRKSMDW